jgi:type II secretory pathway component GspD/PulD (secretin)
MLSRQSGVSIVVGGTLEGTVTANLVDVPFEDALTVILSSHGHRYHWRGSTVVVAAPHYVMRMVDLHFVDAYKVAEALKDLLSEGGLIKAVEDPYAVGLEGGGFASKLIIIDRQARIDEMIDLIEELDRRPVQVSIEAKMVETQLGDNERLGIRWNVSGTLTGATMPSTFPFPKDKSGDSEFSPTPNPGREDVTFEQPEFPPGEFWPYTVADDFVFGKLSAAEFSVVLEALESRRSSNLVSAPSIITLNNTPATIHIGEQIPIAIYERHRETGVMEITGYDQQDVGARLWVAPHVGEDGDILLEIAPEISIIVEFIGQFNERPVTTARTARTQVLAKDGETIVIGGLIQEVKREVKTGVPFLSRIPLVGLLFTHKDTQLEKTDLLIFITPRIITD